MKRIGYLFFSLLWLVEVALIAHDWPVFAAAPVLYWVAVGLATVTIAHTISFYSVGEWLRAPLIHKVKDTAGGVESNEPRPGLHPFLEVVAELICCPICAGTHGATMLLLVYSINQNFGFALAAAAALSTINMFLHWHSERVQWQGRLAIEQQGTIWLAKNYGVQRNLVSTWKDERSAEVDRMLENIKIEEA